MNINMMPRTVMRKKMKIRSDTDMYHTNTFKKFGQIGKQVQKRKPPISNVVIIWLKVLSPSYIQVKYPDSSKSRIRETIRSPFPLFSDL
mmetsp:Transcript_33407/g.68206  ORF Transcript_33407/g.68206 Transcript_33407/m.68206 type:complete len:89 (+) Transcript_33407:619-885(+)